MTAYRLSAQILKRSVGRSAVAAAAYRAGERLYDHRQGRSFDYSDKQGVAHEEIMIPAEAAPVMRHREVFWNSVESSERRSDAQVAREIQLNLPVELSEEAQLEAVREFAMHFVDRGYGVDFAIHRDNPANPHAHLMVPFRTLTGTEFSRTKWRLEKMSERKAELEGLRADWASIQNRSLAREAIDSRVDHRSYLRRGIALEPQPKIGRAASDVALDGRDFVKTRDQEARAVFLRNAKAIEENPLICLQALSSEKATFTRGDVQRWLGKRTDAGEQFQRTLLRVMDSAELVEVGRGSHGETRYSTQGMIAEERVMFSAGARLAERSSKTVSKRVFASALRAHQKATGHSLNDAQAGAARHLLGAPDIAVVEGLAGTGKSHMLGAVRRAWEKEGYQVEGAALAARAAKELENASGIPSRTVRRILWDVENGRTPLTSRSVLVVDEAGMIGTQDMRQLAELAAESKAKLVLIGDAQQLQAINAGAPFRGLGDRFGRVFLDEVLRQEDDRAKAATKALASHNRAEVMEGLRFYVDAGRTQAHPTNDAALAAVVDGWDKDCQEAPRGSHLMLAFRRVEVRGLNEDARRREQARGRVSVEEWSVDTNDGERRFALGDRLLFLENDRGLGVVNGSLGTVIHIQPHVLEDGRMVPEFWVKTDEGREVRFRPDEYTAFDHGYASTVHKSQGVTADRVHVFASNFFDQHKSYVALSRHTKSVNLHYSQETFRDEKELVKRLSRPQPKDLVVDYEEARALVQREQLQRRLAPIQARQAEIEKQRVREAERIQKALEAKAEKHKALERKPEKEQVAKLARGGLAKQERPAPAKSKKLEQAREVAPKKSAQERVTSGPAQARKQMLSKSLSQATSAKRAQGEAARERDLPEKSPSSKVIAQNSVEARAPSHQKAREAVPERPPVARSRFDEAPPGAEQRGESAPRSAPLKSQRAAQTPDMSRSDERPFADAPNARTKLKPRAPTLRTYLEAAEREVKLRDRIDAIMRDHRKRAQQALVKIHAEHPKGSRKAASLARKVRDLMDEKQEQFDTLVRQSRERHQKALENAALLSGRPVRDRDYEHPVEREPEEQRGRESGREQEQGRENGWSRGDSGGGRGMF